MQSRIERQLAELQRLRLATIVHLRTSFAGYGYDVSDCTDAQLSRAILDEASAAVSTGATLFARAYARMHP